MKVDKSGMSKMQKKVASFIAIMAAVMGWQMYTSLTGMGPTAIAADAPLPPPMPTPKAMPLPTPTEQAAGNPQALEMLKVQQEIQAKYLDALNQLQMMKLSRDLAQVNSDIMSAKLAAVQSQKKIVDLLAPGSSGSYGASQMTQTPTSPQTGANGNAQAAPAIATPEPFTAVSVTQLQYKWSAVLRAGDKLMTVREGDVLPDGSKIIVIDKSGVTIDRGGMQMKYSIVSGV